MNLLCIKPYSSSLFYGLIVFSAHTGNNWDLDLRQLLSTINTLMVKKKKKWQNDTFKFNRATSDTLSAVKMFLSSKRKPFFSVFNFRFRIPENILLS